MEKSSFKRYIKGIVRSKMTILSSFTPLKVATNVNFFHSFRMSETTQLMDPIEFHCMKKIKVNGVHEFFGFRQSIPSFMFSRSKKFKQVWNNLM